FRLGSGEPPDAMPCAPERRGDARPDVPRGTSDQYLHWSMIDSSPRGWQDTFLLGVFASGMVLLNRRQPYMAAKRPQKTKPDSDRALRDHLLELLGKGHAHVTFQDAIAAWPATLRGAKPSSSRTTIPITWGSSSCSGACSALGKGTRVMGESAAIRFASPIGELVITASASVLTGVWFPGGGLPGVQPDDRRGPASGL